jgi:hypothetical protein
MGENMAKFKDFIEHPFINCILYLRRIIQTVFRKSHISNYDIADLDLYLAKRILPKIQAYRKKYIEQGICEIAFFLLLGGTGNDENNIKRDLAVIDDVIFAMRWLLEVRDQESDDKKTIAFFNEYYGKYIAESDKDKKSEQSIDAESRAQKGFEAFGKYFTAFRFMLEARYGIGKDGSIHFFM